MKKHLLRLLPAWYSWKQQMNPKNRMPPEPSYRYLGELALGKLISEYDFESVLDLGFGSGVHARELEAAGKRVTALSLARTDELEGFCGRMIIADYSQVTFERPFDCVWASHVLEHQVDPHGFLRKLHGDIREGGVLAITVPPLKDEIVGGHVSLWNGGLLLYRLALAGFDCSNASLKRYGYNISVIVRRTTQPLPELGFCRGDLEALGHLLPPWLRQNANGDVESWNW